LDTAKLCGIIVQPGGGLEMTMLIRTMVLGAMTGAAALALGSCATMSEDQCLAGAWGERGYKDGLEGLAQTRLNDHAEACAKYGVVPETDVYMSAREDGLLRARGWSAQLLHAQRRLSGRAAGA